MPAMQIEALLRAKLVNCGRPVPDREIKDAIKRSVDYAWQPKGAAGQPITPTNAPVKPDLAKIESVVRAGKRMPDLFHESPYWYDEPSPENIIDQLFPGNPMLCCGLSVQKFNTHPREGWRGMLAAQQFIVPSPMSALRGLTDDGKESAHCKANTGPRKFLVIEFDFQEKDKSGRETAFAPMIRSLAKDEIGIHDMCAAILFLLSSIKPMTLAVSSGGKSIHGWWLVEGVSDDQVTPFWRYALSLGADPKTWLKSQFVRVPDGVRENGKVQTALYFDPATLPPYEAPI